MKDRGSEYEIDRNNNYAAGPQPKKTGHGTETKNQNQPTNFLNQMRHLLLMQPNGLRAYIISKAWGKSTIKGYPMVTPKQKGLQKIICNPLILLVAGAGFEPTTFGL